MTVFYVAPDSDDPSGGMRVIYRHVDILNRHGIPAAVLHGRPGFRCTWFTNDTAVVYAEGLTTDSGSDIIVFPEISIGRVPAVAPAVPKVIFNQNAYLTFRMATWTRSGPTRSVSDAYAGLIGVMVVSEDSAAYLRWAFPGLGVSRVHLGIDPDLWSPPTTAPAPILTYMPRRRRDEANQVLHILENRGALRDWVVEPIDGMSEEKVAEALRRSALFLSFGKHEGCPVPPLEAMACGCHVVGYDGYGGAEYFRHPFAHAVPDGDVIAFARAAEEFMSDYLQRPDHWHGVGRDAAGFVQSHYSPATEEADVVDFYRDVLARRPMTASRRDTLSLADFEPRPPWPKRVARSVGLARLLGRGDPDAAVDEGR
jgi:glycosyltransferase involved in cell wall biosynthesis